MKLPIRLVCTDCLNSVEYNGETEGVPLHCPICGGMIDGRLTDQETPTTDVTRIVHPDRNGNEVTPWTETWSKGSLGTIGRYQLRELLGDGGFGQVYQAYDPRLDRDVALKVLKMAAPSERVMQRFFREARAAGRLQHPNIVGVYDAGRDAGRCWIAYQFVKGSTLARRRDSGRMDQESAVRIIRDLADALAYAHREGVYHRDLKPANILIDERGRPRLTDFGLARRADLDSDLTRDGTVIGTPAYMSPEQARGQSNQADERSDVYSLGVMMCELLCGQRPGDQPSEPLPWTAKNRNAPPSPLPPLRSVDRTIPAALDWISLKALAPNPVDRYPNARALADDLDRWLARGRSKTVSALSLVPSLIGLAAGLFMSLVLWIAFPATETFHPSPQPAQAIAGIAARRPPEETKVGQVASEAAAVVPPAEAKASQGIHLVGNLNSKSHRTYHRSDCTSLPRLENQTPLASVEDAENQGFVPCKTCNPNHLRAEKRDSSRP